MPPSSRSTWGADLEPGDAPATAAEAILRLRPSRAAAVVAGVPASVDAVLLEILAGEVGGHLVTIEDWLDSARGVPQPANEACSAPCTRSMAPLR